MWVCECSLTQGTTESAVDMACGVALAPTVILSLRRISCLPVSIDSHARDPSQAQDDGGFSPHLMPEGITASHSHVQTVPCTDLDLSAFGRRSRQILLYPESHDLANETIWYRLIEWELHRTA